jgi:FkbM family methyltransferase
LSSQAQLMQDLWVLFETRSKRGGYLVEFGASDGLELSNTYLLESSFGWRGIVAEPQPLFHEPLRKNRNCFVSTLCVAAKSGSIVQFNQARDPLYSTISDYSAADHHAKLREDGTLIQVETISLFDLLAKAEAPKTIDYLSIDTEGSEFDILRAFDFDRYDVRLISAEHNYSPQRAKIFELLCANGYHHAISEANRIFGFDGWNRETVESRCVLARENRGTFLAVYLARVRVTVHADGPLPI